MDFEQEFEEDENDLDIMGDETGASDTLGGSDADVEAPSDYGAGMTDDVEFAADEVFSPVDESTATEPEAGIAIADANGATFEPSPEAASGSDPADQGPYIDVATVSESAPPVPPSGGAPINVGASSSGATSFDAPPNREASVHTPNSDLSPHSQQMPHPNYERGQPPVCPIVIVRLGDDQMDQAHQRAMAESSQRDARLATELAEEMVHQEFWRRDCQERAILGH